LALALNQHLFPHWKARAWLPIIFATVATFHHSTATVVLCNQDLEPSGKADLSLNALLLYTSAWWFLSNSYSLSRHPAMAAGIYFLWLLPFSVAGHLWRTRNANRAIFTMIFLAIIYLAADSSGNYLGLAISDSINMSSEIP